VGALAGIARAMMRTLALILLPIVTTVRDKASKRHRYPIVHTSYPVFTCFDAEIDEKRLQMSSEMARSNHGHGYG
jgi:hypothetical protein